MSAIGWTHFIANAVIAVFSALMLALGAGDIFLVCTLAAVGGCIFIVGCELRDKRGR